MLPILLWLAVTRGRRALAAALAGGALGLAALGVWGYVLNGSLGRWLFGAFDVNDSASEVMGTRLRDRHYAWP